jgi:hypothetical protein
MRRAAMTSSSRFVTYDNDIVGMLMKHGATLEQAKSIMVEVYTVPFSACQDPDKWKRSRDRTYQMAKWAIEKAKEYGRQNAATTMGYRE